MEDDMRKKGALFLQQQRFGKRWKRVWAVLFRESPCSVSRLEIYDWNDRTEKTNPRKHQDNKKVIRMSSCIRVSAVDVDGCPKDTGSFLIETTEKIFVFAADKLQLDEWTQRLCETAFPMNWADPGLQRASSLKNPRAEPNQNQNLNLNQNQNQNQGASACMEDNSLYSERQQVPVFRVMIRRTDASERCRLKGEAVLRADADALQLLDRCGQVLFSWPYRYLRRFGRDKTTFSFEAGRRCDSGEGSFEFDTKAGNAVFIAVETAINLQRMTLPQKQTSLGLDSPSPIARSLPPRPEEPDPVYSLVNDSALPISFKDRESPSPTQRHRQGRLEPPVDKVLTAVKSLTLETRDAPVHRKNQVKMISSCPLPGDSAPSATGHAPSGPRGHAQTYAHIEPDRKKKPKTQASNGSGSRSFESEYSLPFDLVTPDLVTPDLRMLGGGGGGGGGGGAEEAQRSPMADPLYDSIDEFQIRNIFLSNKPEHIYDEPEGCQKPGPGLGAGSKMASAGAAASLYDEPEEMRGEAWRIMGTEQDPRGHEFPYNPRADDYAVPKRPQRAFPQTQGPQEPQEPEEDQEHEEDPELDLDLDPEEKQGAGPQNTVSPYNNLPLKTEDQL